MCHCMVGAVAWIRDLELSSFHYQVEQLVSKQGYEVTCVIFLIYSSLQGPIVHMFETWGTNSAHLKFKGQIALT